MPPTDLVLAFEPWWPTILGRLFNALLPLESLRPRVTSWYRDPDQNARVGGDPRSQHLLGLAFDVVPPRREIAASLRVNGFTVVNEGSHIHAQVFPAGGAAPLFTALRL